MARQGFMGKISRWFSGPSDTYFFGLQIVVRCYGEDTLRSRFATVLAEARTGDEGSCLSSQAQARRRLRS